MSFELRELHAAILAHYSASDLGMLLRFKFDKKLEDIGSGSKNEVVFKLIEAAQDEGWLEKLICAVAEERKDIARLQAIRDAYARHLKKSGTPARVVGPKRNAIRCLFPFEGDDILPGEARRREAQAIATSIRSDDFRCSVVCGDSGCGKTSMLRTEVARALHKDEFDVVYLRDPRRLVTVAAKGLAPADRLESALAELRKMLPSGGKVVLILDQFEDFFFDYPAPEQRSRIRGFFEELTSAALPTRVVCGLRRDAFLDFYNMGFPHPKHIVLRVENLTPKEAEEVILECAREDGLEITPAFANTLASELQADGFVRPPELQLVCRHLKGSLNEKTYQKLDRKTGILASHVKDAIKNCAVERTAARLLRSLCDFPRRRRGEPKSVEALAGEVEGREVSPEGTNTEVVLKVLSQFEQDQLVKHDDREGASRVYSLVHDYLVEAISRATDDIATRAEEANQWLRYYLSARDEVMPWRRLLLIRRLADRKLLAEPAARRLIRRRLVRPVFQGAGIVAIVALLMCSVYLYATVGVKWEKDVIGRHLMKGGNGLARVRLVRCGKVLTQADQGSLAVWDGESGERLGHLDSSTHVWIGPAQDILVMTRPSLDEVEPPRLVRIHLPDGKQTELPLPLTKFSRADVAFSNDGKIVAVSINEPIRNTTITALSLEDNKIVGTIRMGPEYNWKSSASMVLTADRLIYPSSSSVRICRVRDGNLIKEVKLERAPKPDEDWPEVAVSTDGSLVAIYQKGEKNYTVVLCNLASGAEVRRQSFESKIFKFAKFLQIRFADDGRTLLYLVTSFPSYLGQNFRSAPTGPAFFAVEVSDLSPVGGVPWGETAGVFSRKGVFVGWKINPNDFSVWQVGVGKHRVLEGFEIMRGDRLEISEDETRLLTNQDAGPPRLWGMDTGGPIAMPNLPAGSKNARFTDDGHTVMVRREGGNMALFDPITGKELVESLPELEPQCVTYNAKRQQVLVWNKDGQVIRYRRGRYFFGRFVPTVR